MPHPPGRHRAGAGAQLQPEVEEPRRPRGQLVPGAPRPRHGAVQVRSRGTVISGRLRLAMQRVLLPWMQALPSAVHNSSQRVAHLHDCLQEPILCQVLPEPGRLDGAHLERGPAHAAHHGAVRRALRRPAASHSCLLPATRGWLALLRARLFLHSCFTTAAHITPYTQHTTHNAGTPPRM